MPLYTVEPGGAELSLLPVSSYVDLNILERRHLEAWLAETPDVIGEKLIVIDTEFDQFLNSRERLDILALTPSVEGQLKMVIVELKRTTSDTTADLQAVKYAAYCWRFDFALICEALAKSRTRTARRQDRAAAPVSVREAREDLLRTLEWPSGEPDPVIDDRPAIVLVSPEFRPEVLTTVDWLTRIHGLEMACVQLIAHEIDPGRLVLLSQRVLPIEEPPWVIPSNGTDPPNHDGAIDREALRRLVAAIPKGKWVSYGDLAWALGRPKAAFPIGTMIARDKLITNAHRVLTATGAIPDRWKATDGGGKGVCIARWKEDGVDIAGAALPEDRRWPRSELARVLALNPA